MRLLPLLLAALIAGPAMAQIPRPSPKPVAAPEPEPTPEVSAVTIMQQTTPPKLVSTYPAAGQAVAPGVLILKVTFDQKMMPTRFDFSPGVTAPAPKCLKTPRLLDDAKTFVLLCTVEAGKAYALSFNAAPSGGFANIGDYRAQPAALAFSANTDAPVRSLEDALKVASLKPTEKPIQEPPPQPAIPQ
jgi:hypothetical protein